MAKENVLIDQVAKALFNHAIKRAREDAGKIQFDMSGSVAVFRQMSKETDTGIAIITAAYFDECLKRLFSLLIDDSKKSVFRSIFEFQGPLGTFSSRINMAFGLGFVSKSTHERVDAIRKIRNEFAHNPFGITFRSPKVSDRIKSIDAYHKIFIDEIRKSFEIREITKQPSRLNLKELFLVKSALSLSFMVSELIAFPVAKQNQIPVGTILSDYENLPENLKDIRRKTAECIIEIFETNSSD